MAAARLDTAAGSENTNSEPSQSYSVSAGSDRMLVAAVGWESNPGRTVNGVTYGGEAMTLVGYAQNAGGGFVNGAAMYYILDAGIEAAVGTTVAFDMSGDLSRWIMTVASYSGVDQTGGATTLIDNAEVETDDSTPNPIILDVTEESDGLVAAHTSCGNDATCSWNATMTEQYDATVSNTAAGSYADRLSSTDANVDVEPTWDDQNRAAGIAGAFAPAGATVHEGICAMTAAGVVTVAETAIRGAVSAMTGAGVLTSIAGAIRPGVVAMAGAGTLTSVATTFYPAVCAMTGSGVVTVVAGALRPGVSSMAGTGVVTVAETAIRAGVVSMTGSGTVTVASTAIRSGVVSMTGTGTVTASATVITSAKVGQCAMAGSGTVTVAETAIRTAVVAMTGAGTVTAVAGVIRLGASGMSGSGTVTVIAGALRPGVTAMTGSGVVTAAATAIRSAIVSMTGTGTLTSSATVISGAVWAGVCAMTASGTLTVTGTRLVPAGVRVRVTVAAQDRTLDVDAHSRSVVAGGPSRIKTVFDDNDGTA